MVLSGPAGSASFKYDAQGRRIEKTVNGVTTGFLYDGGQAIGELKGSALETTYHTGLAIDEVLARYGAAGNRALLTDALMSAIAQANEDQSIQNFYAYSPYGETAVLGAGDGNSLRYTGREDDGTGLYYYRARYYDPVLKRFISEDPIGIAGGMNLMAYVKGDPVSFNDPLGLMASLRQILTMPGGAAGEGAGAAEGIHAGTVARKKGEEFGKALCATNLSNQGLWSDCTQRCLTPGYGSDGLVICTRSCEAAYKDCKKDQKSSCPVPGMS